MLIVPVSTILCNFPSSFSTFPSVYFLFSNLPYSDYDILGPYSPDFPWLLVRWYRTKTKATTPKVRCSPLCCESCLSSPCIATATKSCNQAETDVSMHNYGHCSCQVAAHGRPWCCFARCSCCCLLVAFLHGRIIGWMTKRSTLCSQSTLWIFLSKYKWSSTFEEFWLWTSCCLLPAICVWLSDVYRRVPRLACTPQ